MIETNEPKWLRLWKELMEEAKAPSSRGDEK
jgi:hypothetical protein